MLVGVLHLGFLSEIQNFETYEDTIRSVGVPEGDTIKCFLM